jgi:branched-chain amino acid transport system ATP-binding protein
VTAPIARTSTNGSVDRREVLLCARSVSVGYGQIPVVRELDLTVHAGEVVALLGANGAGKSTTLLGLAGHLPLTTGSVEWLGRPTTSPMHRRCREGLGFVPETRSVIFSLSVAENLRLGGGDLAAATALFPELAPLMKRKGGLLSGGEQQMLSLARVLSRRPKVLLADELSLGLAPLIIVRLLAAVRQAADEWGVGVLIVEQQVRNALHTADTAAVLKRGRIVLHDAAASLIDRIDEVEAMYLSADSESSKVMEQR